MGRLAQMAGAARLKGAVTVTTKGGATINYASEAEAEKGTVGMTLEHRRGAFFEVGAKPSKHSPASHVPAPVPPPVPPPTPMPRPKTREKASE